MSSNSANPAVSIIICTYMRAELLRRTLLSLETVQDREQAEVIVVDNHSLDHTAAVVHACIEQLRDKVNIRYVFEPKQGLSVARNTGIALSKAPIAAFLDDDAVPLANWLASIRRAFAEHKQAGAIGGIIHPEFETERPIWLEKQLEFPYTIVNLGDRELLYPRGLTPFGANMAVRREAIGDIRFPEELGRKGSSLISGEEVWFFDRLTRSGWQLRYIPDMAVRHYIAKDRLSRDWIRRRYFYQGVSMAMEGKGMFGRLRIVSKIAMRRLYNTVYSYFANTPGEQMLGECREESIRGAVSVLRSKGAEVTYD